MIFGVRQSGFGDGADLGVRTLASQPVNYAACTIHHNAMNALLPLQGIKVLDLSRVLAGPLAAMTLGDLGAQVIKVERPGTGDDTRGWGPPFDPQGDAAYFHCANRNKLSVAADLADPGDRALLETLVAGADLVLDNFLPGVLERHGLDPDTLLARCPQLLWCTVSGFGPPSRRPGYDFVVQAEQGWMAITGEPEGAPMKAGVALADLMAGKDAVIALLALLAARERNPGPLPAADRRLQVSLAHSALAGLANVAANTLVSGAEARRWGNAHPNLVPYQLFHAADRPLVLAVGTDAQWLAAARALDLPALADDPALATNAGRLTHRDRVVDALAPRFATAPAAHWIDRLGGVGVPCGVVRTVREALEGSGATAGGGIPPAAPGTVRLPPPRLDAHGPLIREHHWSAFAHLPIPREPPATAP
jgi:crotonobetainyl-CoA:carnitine CoA-transferase CaiB-like acyl-CoA transferase